MPHEFTTGHALSLLVVGLLNLALAAYILRTRSRHDVIPLGIFLVGIALWTIPQGLLLVETDPAVGFALAKTVDSGAVIMSTGLFHFAMAYAGREDWLRLRRLGAVYAITGAWVVLTWTNPAHGLMHDPMQFTEVLLPVEEYQNPIYWVYVFYNWTLSGAGIYVFFLEYLDARGSDVYHKQARLVLLAPLIPGVANVLAFNETTAINYSVWGFGATGILIAVALYRYRWLDLVPVARDRVIDGMQDGYLVVDHKRRVVDLNPAARTLLEDDNVVGSPIDTVLPECRPLLDGETREVTITRNGAVVDASVSALADDRIDGFVLMLRDVTEQRRAEKRFQALIENVSDLITVVDDDGRVTYASPSVRPAIGYRPEELAGEFLLEFVHADDRSDAAEAFAALRDGPAAETRFEYRLRHRDGSWVVLEGVAVDLLENDIVGGIVINSRDVTERNDRERELERTNRRLEEFAGVISHDLRTPLRIAKTYAEFAEASAKADDFRAVSDAHDRMERMITSLLTMARTGVTLEEPSPVVLAAVVEDAWEITRRDGATLDCDLDLDWSVVGDRDQLLHVFENLFRNAIEHNDAPVALRVSHLGDDPDRGFAVADDGVGIPPEYRELVFERGQTTSEEGAGFGLAIVRDVVEAHGWTIDACESRDGGARFEITFDSPTA
ncbi:histidine kinase N-terminal 7TM domain-containing protein [Natrononativus amylolyticus]|uniref:histidine kinase N-terminal 7TM domain-containing protein n=1 Tax=Natrononativus amylolyticus TaxID=2963434 RepID=UPI0020CBCF31|nr:histidine kinase N-terminal 7TM domain-containing protein [Natrononativus amylolyticus]